MLDKDNNILQFRNFHKQLQVPFVIYADFEAITEKKTKDAHQKINLKYASELFQNEPFKLMKQKGVYPYDYMDSLDKFNEKKLTSKDNFYSILIDEDITDENYSHAQNVWKTFKLKSMG